MSFTDPYLADENTVTGKGQRGDHAYSTGKKMGAKVDTDARGIVSAQDRDSEAFQHNSASGFAPAGKLNKGAPEFEGRTALPGATDASITTKVSAPSHTTNIGDVVVPLD